LMYLALSKMIANVTTVWKTTLPKKNWTTIFKPTQGSQW
jgi:hypothetical protein